MFNCNLPGFSFLGPHNAILKTDLFVNVVLQRSLAYWRGHQFLFPTSYSALFNCCSGKTSPTLRSGVGGFPLSYQGTLC